MRIWVRDIPDPQHCRQHKKAIERGGRGVRNEKHDRHCCGIKAMQCALHRAGITIMKNPLFFKNSTSGDPRLMALQYIRCRQIRFLRNATRKECVQFFSFQNIRNAAQL
jgi:hypothetical protein